MAYQTFTPRHLTRFKLWMWVVGLIIASGLVLAISQLSHGFIHTLPIWGLWVLPGLLLLRYGFNEQRELKEEVAKMYQRLVDTKAFQPASEVDLGLGRRLIVAEDNDQMMVVLPMAIHRFKRADLSDWKLESTVANSVATSGGQHKVARRQTGLRFGFHNGDTLFIKHVSEPEAVTRFLDAL